MKNQQKKKERLEQLPDTPCWRDYPYIFISYSQDDFEDVYPIIDELRAIGNPAWFDGDIEYGELWKDKIDSAISNCSLFMCLISKRFESSRYCEKEVSKAIEAGVSIIPVYLEKMQFSNVELQKQLGGMQAVLWHECGNDTKLLSNLLQNNQTYMNYLEKLSDAMNGSESVALRKVLARKKNLSTDKMKLLSKDPSSEVREIFNKREDVYGGEYMVTENK